MGSFLRLAVKAFLVLAGLALAYHLCAFAVETALDMPEVHISYLTKECVSVEFADGTKGSCDKLPKRYNTVWMY